MRDFKSGLALKRGLAMAVASPRRDSGRKRFSSEKEVTTSKPITNDEIQSLLRRDSSSMTNPVKAWASNPRISGVRWRSDKTKRASQNKKQITGKCADL